MPDRVLQCAQDESAPTTDYSRMIVTPTKALVGRVLSEAALNKQ